MVYLQHSGRDVKGPPLEPTPKIGSSMIFLQRTEGVLEAKQNWDTLLDVVEEVEAAPMPPLCIQSTVQDGETQQRSPFGKDNGDRSLKTYANAADCAIAVAIAPVVPTASLNITRVTLPAQPRPKQK